MMRIVTRLVRIDEAIGKVEMVLCIFMLVVMVVIVGLNVVLRYIFGDPIIAAMNLATMMLVWLTFFGASQVYKQKGHIALVFITERFPRRIRLITGTVVSLVIATVLVTTVVLTVRLMAVQARQFIVALGIPRSVLSIPVVIAGSLMVFTTIRHLVTELSAPETEEGDE